MCVSVTLLRLISAEGEGRVCDVSVTLLPLIPAEGEGRAHGGGTDHRRPVGAEDRNHGHIPRRRQGRGRHGLSHTLGRCLLQSVSSTRSHLLYGAIL